MSEPFVPFSEQFNRAFAAFAEKLEPMLPPDTAVKFDLTPIDVTKVSAIYAVPPELLMDIGEIPDTRPPVHISRRRRLRWWLSERRERVAQRAYRVLSGQPFPDPSDW